MRRYRILSYYITFRHWRDHMKLLPYPGSPQGRGVSWTYRQFKGPLNLFILLLIKYIYCQNVFYLYYDLVLFFFFARRHNIEPAKIYIVQVTQNKIRITQDKIQIFSARNSWQTIILENFKTTHHCIWKIFQSSLIGYH